MCMLYAQHHDDQHLYDVILLFSIRRNLRLGNRELIKVIQGYLSRKWKSENSNQGILTPK